MMPTASAAPADGADTERTRPEERLAVAFAQHVARWAHEQGAAPAARRLIERAARRVSLKTSDGHSCLGVDELLDGENEDTHPPLDLATLRGGLLASKVVGTPGAPGALPLILDDERLYLHRYFDYECRLAASLAARRAGHPHAPGAATLPDPVVALLGRLFPGHAQPAAPDWQKLAAITALLGRLTIISGGPGTGKTTTVVGLLACLLEADPGCRIALTAPTGKAAARLTEVILQRAGHLPDALRARLPTASFTIHRLLGGLPHGEFRHHAGNPLPIDVLVVDEASMLDLALAVHLIEAVPANARVILLGDKDQLAAVESGAVFSELSARPTFSAARIQALSRLAGVPSESLQSPPGGAPLQPASGAGLEDSVIWLRHNYRFAAASAIGLLATDINDGNAGGVLDRLGAATDASLVWHNDGGSMPSQQAMRAIVGGYAPYVEAVRTHTHDPAAIAAAFARFRVLCALRGGPWGIDALNREISAQVRRTLQHPLDPGLRSEWYPGRPVMVLRNDPVLKLFNGDIGIVLPDPHAVLQVWFPVETGGLRPIAPVRLPEHETAYALTVHKSQGSEFESVLLVLPADMSRVLTRELLYTAVTRARERLTIVANAGVLAATVAMTTKRASGLAARIVPTGIHPPQSTPRPG
jgi:exodeoxyribonuclease V alpha subunit